MHQNERTTESRNTLAGRYFSTNHRGELAIGSLLGLEGFSHEQLIGCHVVDQSTNEVGSLHLLWSDQDTDEIKFLGVRMGSPYVQSHLVPAQDVTWDEAAKTLRLPYEKQSLVEAPAILADAELTQAYVDDIHRYFGTEDTAGSNDASRLRRTTRPDALGTNADHANSGSVEPVLVELMGTPRPLGEMEASDFADAALPTVSSSNVSPISGELGSHLTGTTTAALGAGLAGAAIGGALGGPIGAPVGAVIGAIVGGLTGNSIAEAVNPTNEEARWLVDLEGALPLREGCDLSDYLPAFKVGYEGFRRSTLSGHGFEEMEAELHQEFEQTKGASRLSWEDAKIAVRTAWARAMAKAADNKLE